MRTGGEEAIMEVLSCGGRGGRGRRAEACGGDTRETGSGRPALFVGKPALFVEIKYADAIVVSSVVGRVRECVVWSKYPGEGEGRAVVGNRRGGRRAQLCRKSEQRGGERSCRKSQKRLETERAFRNGV